MLRDCVLGCSRVIIKVVTISIVAGPRFVVKHTCSNAEIEPAARGIILHPQQYQAFGMLIVWVCCWVD